MGADRVQPNIRGRAATRLRELAEADGRSITQMVEHLIMSEVKRRRVERATQEHRAASAGAGLVITDAGQYRRISHPDDCRGLLIKEIVLRHPSSKEANALMELRLVSTASHAG